MKVDLRPSEAPPGYPFQVRLAANPPASGFPFLSLAGMASLQKYFSK
jgi:hypothetical protein